MKPLRTQIEYQNRANRQQSDPTRSRAKQGNWVMAKKTDKRQKTLESLQVDSADIGDEIWSEDTVSNFDDDTLNDGAQAATSQSEADANEAENANATADQAATSPRRSSAASRRPGRASKFRTREEIFEHRMAVMAHRRAQLEAHRNRQTRNWFAFTGALLVIGASGLGGFYYKSNDWKFLSSYSFGTTEIQSVEIASAPPKDVTSEHSSSSHFQTASAVAILPPAKVQQPVAEVTELPTVKVPQQLETLVEKIAEQAPREPVAPKVVAETPPAPERIEAKVAPAEPAPQEVAAVAKRLVRIAPTASPAPEAVSNLNRSQTAVARDNTNGEWVMVPVETKVAQPEQSVASLSPRVTAPKTKSATPGKDATTRSADDAAIETALSLPPKALALDSNSALTEETPANGLLGPLLAKDGKDVTVLLERGDELLLLGDIVSARQLYKHAFQQGNLSAAARIGTTYDPRIFAQLGVHGLKPDSKMALDWYNKAVDAGDESARQTARTLSAQIGQP